MAAPSAPDVAVARLTDTSVRVTFSNSDGSPTNHAMFATVADGGDTWTDGGNRSGDGAIDITTGLTGGTEYYFAGYSDDTGYYSIFSNVIKLLITADASNTPVLFMGYPKLLEQPTFKSKSRDHIYYQYKYELAVNQTLALASLNYGDALPEDSTATIMEAKLVKSPGKANNMAIVVARFSNEWAD